MYGEIWAKWNVLKSNKNDEMINYTVTNANWIYSTPKFWFFNVFLNKNQLNFHVKKFVCRQSKRYDCAVFMFAVSTSCDTQAASHLKFASIFLNNEQMQFRCAVIMIITIKKFFGKYQLVCAMIVMTLKFSFLVFKTRKKKNTKICNIHSWIEIGSWLNWYFLEYNK